MKSLCVRLIKNKIGLRWILPMDIKLNHLAVYETILIYAASEVTRQHQPLLRPM